jgi:hypothetical protein
LGIQQIGPVLKITGVLRWLAFHNARMGGRYEIRRLVGGRRGADDLLHRLSEFVEADRFIDQIPRL